MVTMNDVTRRSIQNEALLYRLFDVNAKLLIDHTWGWEPCTMVDIKAYQPQTSSISSGQVLHFPYDYQKARLIVREMMDLVALDLVAKGLVTNQLVLIIGYAIKNLKDLVQRNSYRGPVTTDFYGRNIPEHVREINTPRPQSFS